MAKTIVALGLLLLLGFSGAGLHVLMRSSEVKQKTTPTPPPPATSERETLPALLIY